MPNSQPPVVEVQQAPAPQTDQTTAHSIMTIALGQATLTERVNRLIDDHERRILALENRGKGWPTVLAAIIATATFVVIVIGKVPWQ